MAAHNTALTLAGFVCVLSGCTTGLNDNNIVFISAPEVQQLVADAAKPGRSRSLALVDPRAASEFVTGHLPRAINVEPIQHGQKPPKTITGARYVVVCGRDPGDALARGMTKRLMESGVGGVRLFSGGIKEWSLRGWELEPLGADPFPQQPEPESPGNAP